MSSPSDRIELTLFGQKTVLRHRTDDPRLVDQAVQLVTERIKEAQARTPKGSAPHHVALVALLDLAAEYVQAKSRTAEHLRQVALKSGELQAWIESELK